MNTEFMHLKTAERTAAQSLLTEATGFLGLGNNYNLINIKYLAAISKTLSLLTELPLTALAGCILSALARYSFSAFTGRKFAAKDAATKILKYIIQLIFRLQRYKDYPERIILIN